MRRFLRILFWTLVLVLVFLVSALTAMRFAIHGREVAVPRLTGMTVAEAERAAIDNGLALQVESRFYSADVPEGRVMSQQPPAGEKVRRGWRVRVAQSLGPQRVAIPDVVGQSPRAAEINLGRRGLELGTVASVHVPGAPPDQVVAQSPPPNAEGVVSPRINLLLSAPAEAGPQFYVMPDFSGRTLAEASIAIKDAGFRLGAVAVANNGANGTAGNGARQRAAASDIIARQWPTAGQKIAAGTTISLEVAK